MIYGYARVSTDGQSVDAQLRQLRAAGAGQVFRETASGAKTDRAQLRRVLGQLAAGDVLMQMKSVGAGPAGPSSRQGVEFRQPSRSSRDAT